MNMDEDTRKAVDKIEKLMRLAGANPNEAEAASALAKAQELLVAYNLDMSVIEQNSGQSGKRLSEMVNGGMHRYQRSLWGYIAELNFCRHWTQKNRAEGKRRFVFQHQLVGRVVNVAASKNMAQYIEKTIGRLCAEKFVSQGLLCSTRDAMAYREGIADRVIEKICERRDDFIKKEERAAAEAARRASAAGISLATALTVAGLAEKEEAGNYDFIHGEGAWTRKQQRDAEWEAGREERRVRQAKANQEAEAAHAAWAAAHPEEARKEAAKDRARERARERRQENGGGYGRRYRFRQTAADMRRDSGSYHAGYAKGEEVSIDPQVDKGAHKRIGR